MSHNKSRSSVGANQEKSKGYIIKKLLVGSAVGSAVFFAVAAIMALLILKTDLPQNSVPVLGIAAAAISAFAAGFIGVRPFRKNGIAYGLLSVMPQTVFLITILFFNNAGSLGTVTLIMALAMAAAGGLGGIAAANLKKRR